MNILKGVFAIILLVTAVWSRQLTYHDFKVFTVNVENEEQLNVLKNLEHDDGGYSYSYWKDPILGRDADIVVPPNKLSDFGALVSALNLNSTLKIANIQRFV